METQDKLYDEWAPKKLRMWQFLVFRSYGARGSKSDVGLWRRRQAR